MYEQVRQKLRLSRGIMIVSSRDEQRYEIFLFFARKFPSSLTKKYLIGVWMFPHGRNIRLKL